MALITPELGQIDLSQGRGSSIPVVDTYARPAVPDRGSQLQELGKALSGFGSSFDALSKQQQQIQEQQDLKTAEVDATNNMVNGVQQDVRSGTPKMVQQGLFPAYKSPAVQFRVSEMQGAMEAVPWMNNQLHSLYADPNTLGHPDAIEKWKAATRAAALQQFGTNKAYGAGFISTVNNEIDKQGSAAMERINQQMLSVAEQGISFSTGQAVDNARDTSAGGSNITWKTVGQDTGSDYSLLKAAANGRDVDHLNATFAGRLNSMLASAPPEVRNDIKIVSGYRSYESQASLHANRVAREKAANPGISDPRLMYGLPSG
jgi:hypothetical protein